MAARTTEAVRPLRADARRNRDAILRAAREAFEDEGVFTSLDGVAAASTALAPALDHPLRSRYLQATAATRSAR